MTVLTGCGSDTPTGIGPGSSTGGADCTWVGDPDRGGIVRVCQDIGDCEALPNAEKKCTVRAEPAPGGGGGWICTRAGEFYTCERDGSGSGSGSGSGAPDGPSIGGGLAGGGTPCWCPAEPSGGGSASGPFAVIKTQRTTINGQTVLKARVEYTKTFCDNSYGESAIGWDQSKKGEHKFKDLVGSDHSVLYFENCDGDVVAATKLDYISEDASRPSGYGSLGVSGGDGKMELGDIADVVGASSSLDVNFNTHGHVLTTDSPAADAQYKVVDAQYASWIFEMWYEVDLKWSAFGPSGACRVRLESLHASPAKGGENTVAVVPCQCN
ncbi:MAG: hypothetical protein KC503_47515 [Myxococcales bacterium]|nr:hypothetical protein [Myxococcales bacterium]